MDKIKLSIIIPTKNREIRLFKAVQSISSQSCLTDELIIVDQSETSNSESQIRKLIKGVFPLIYIHDSTLVGLTAARNVGVKNSSGDIIFFMDDDAILLESAIRNLKKVFENDINKSIGGVGVAISNYTSPFLYSLDNYIFHHGPFKGIRYFDFFQRNYKQQHLGLFKSSHIGGVACYRRRVFEEFQFDSDYSGYGLGEDYIFAYSVSKKHKTYFASNVEIVHERSVVREESKEIIIYRYINFWFYFYYRYLPKTFYNTICYLLVNLSMLLRLFRNIFSSKVIKIIVKSYVNILKHLVGRKSIDIFIRDILNYENHFC